MQMKVVDRGGKKQQKQKGILNKTWHPVLPVLGVMIVMLSSIL